MMDTMKITGEEELDFSGANRLADAAAAEALGGEPVCLSWYDRARDHESPAHLCQIQRGGRVIPGYVEYARSRGAQLMMDVDAGAYVFCYLSAREFEG